MIYKYTTSYDIIAKVFSDMELDEESHRIYDMIDWIGEAVKKIGGPTVFEKKVTGYNDLPDIEVSNYEAILPSDLHRVIQVFYSQTKDGVFYPMRRASGSLDGIWRKNESTSSVDGQGYIEGGLIELAMLLYDLTYEEALQQLNDGTLNRDLLVTLSTNTSSLPSYSYDDRGFDLQYYIQNGKLRLNQKSGYIRLSYEAMPVDGNGYPLVPDNESYREAVYWYIVMKLLYSKYLLGKISRDVYYDAKSSYNFYAKQAYANALMPDRDMFESIKNTWVRLIPEFTEHDSGYHTMGQRQIYYNNNY